MADQYLIRVLTGGADNAGTDADVFITLIGANGKSKEISLDNPTNNFEKDHVDVFNINSTDIGNIDLGEIKQIRIRHDNSGENPGWFLKYVTVDDLNTDKIWTFPANRWLAKDENDGRIDLILDPLPGENRANERDGIPQAGVPIVDFNKLVNATLRGDNTIGWIWVDSNQKFKDVTGVVTESFVTHTDFPTTHDSHDQNTHILVDPEFDNLISIANDAGEIEVEWETGILPSELKGDGMNPIFPKWVWPSPGDRVWLNGNWIYDAGHPIKNERGQDIFRSEIHPPRAFATMRDQVVPMPDTGSIPIRVTATDLYIHGNGGYVTQVLKNPDLAVKGGDNDSNQFSPIDDDFDFDILLPPKPSDTAIFTYSITDGLGNVNRVNVEPVLTPDLANNKVHVHIPLEGTGILPSEVYARHINVGWAFPTTNLHHFQLTLTKMDLHNDMEFRGNDAELTFSWLNVDKAGSDAWKRLSNFATGNMNDYDDDRKFLGFSSGNGEMGFNGLTFDFYVADGQTATGKSGETVTIKAHAYEQDEFDDLFGEHGALVDSRGFPTSLALRLARADQLGNGDNDKYNVLNYSFNASSPPTTFTVPNPDKQYELFFELKELPPTPAELNKPPIANANGPYSVERGASITLSSAGSSDPDGSITSFQWDFNYDGVNFDVDATGMSPTFSAGLSEPSPQTVALRAIDNLGIASIATSTVTLENPTNVIVDSLVDENDGNLSAGDVSLREAIALVSAGGTINFASSLAGGTITLTEGELVINKNLNINGLGADELTISGNNASRVFRIDDGTSNLIDVEIKNLTIASGNANAGGNVGEGGGILNSEKLILSDSTLSDNIAAFGGGIENKLDSTLILSNSTFKNNQASSSGGGIDNSGNLTVNNSTFSGNTAALFGGGINNSGNLTVNNSTLTGNQAKNGGGIEHGSDTTLTVSNSTISDNTATSFGGGIDNFGDTVIVTNSAISSNTAGENGGGINNFFGNTLTILNSTISGNKAGNFGGGIQNGENLTVKNSTITANTADSDSNGTGDGGGINNFITGTVEIQNTIVAKNFDNSLAPAQIHPDVSGSFTNTSFNLIGDSTGSTGFTNGVNGNIVGTSTNPIDPKLGPLQDNGSPTFTHALLDGSPAINAGNNANIPAGIDTDQRGEPRIVGGTVDIGAFESAFTPVVLPIIVTPGDDTVTGTPGNDTVISGGGQDQIFGGSGDDLLDGGDGDDRVSGGEDNDTLLGGSGQDQLSGDSGNDSLDGGDGDDKLFGGEGNDTLLGGQGQDRLFGDSGDDLLNGGSGDNTLTGGAGKDIFVVSTAGKNNIVDFEDGRDLLKLEGGLTFGQLSIFEQNGDTWITTNTNQPLAFLTGIDSNLITVADFSV